MKRFSIAVTFLVASMAISGCGKEVDALMAQARLHGV